MKQYKLIKSFRELKQEYPYQVTKNGDIYLNTEERLIKYDFKSKSDEVVINENIHWFTILEQQLIYQKKRGESLFFLNNNGIIGHFYLNKSLNFNNKLLFDRKNIKKCEYETVLLYDDLSLVPINLNYFPNKIISETSYISIALNTLFLYKFNNQLIWQHNFSDLLKGEEIKQHGEIIVHKGILYVYLADKRNNKNTATIAIDVETGEIKNKYKGFAGKLFLYKNKLYTASYYKVQILDIETEQILEIDFTDTLKAKDLQIHWNNFIVEDDYIYFIDGHWATTNRMGILDLKNKKLVWETSIKINDGINNNIREIKISENRLYSHCSDKSLHIFEKEE